MIAGYGSCYGMNIPDEHDLTFVVLKFLKPHICGFKVSKNHKSFVLIICTN